MNLITRSKKLLLISFSAILFIFLVFFTLGNLALNLLHRQNLELLQNNVAEYSTHLQARLGNEINESLNLVLGLTGFITVNPDCTHNEFETIARVILNRSSIIKNIGLAPDNVIRFMYPLKGNEQALGLNYMEKEDQKDAVLRAIQYRTTIIAGPVNLVQGGEGFIARVPIFIGEGLDEYWGIASIVVDKEKLLNSVGIQDETSWLRIAIRGKDGLGAEGEIIYGSEDVFKADPLTTRVLLPHGNWEIGLVPINGWTPEKSIWDIIIPISVFCLSLLISLLILKIIDFNRKLNFLALHDPLTSISNRRMFQLQAEKYLQQAGRKKIRIYLIYFDFDNFKKVNDLYGHKKGDQVLKRAAKKITENIRKTDIFSRVGGDEFLLMPGFTEKKADLQTLCTKILNVMNNLPEEMNMDLDLGCSIGISVYPDDGRDIDELIRKADSAMYYSKKNGKNRISYYSEIKVKKNI